MPNLNTVDYRVYVDRRKKLKDKRQRNFGFPFKLGDFPLETTKLPFVMVRFMKSVYNDISRTFSKNYHAFLRSYHGTMPGIIFFRHVFQFSRVEKPINDTFVVDSWDTCP